MSRYETNVERAERCFQDDVKNHSMEIVKDDGLYRHIRFSKGSSIVLQFSLVTWPGYLAITGDMGCFVFSRVTDMFEFHRLGESKSVPYRYWAEKIQCGSSQSPDIAGEFSEQLLRRAMFTEVMSLVRGMEKSERPRAIEELRELYDGVEFTEHNLSCIMGSEICGEYPFHELYEYTLTQESYHFAWCCNAIAWGIKRYDEMVSDAKEESAPETGVEAG